MNIFIAQTLDGRISGPGHSLTHLEAYMSQAYGYESMIARAGAVVLGRTTFDRIYPEHGWVYADRLPGVVMTSRPLPTGVPGQVAGASDPRDVAAKHPDAFIDGGGETIRGFLEIGAVAEARIFTLPIIIGAGARLFPDGRYPTSAWSLMETRRFENGVFEARYRID